MIDNRIFVERRICLFGDKVMVVFGEAGGPDERAQCLAQKV